MINQTIAGKLTKAKDKFKKAVAPIKTKMAETKDEGLLRQLVEAYMTEYEKFKVVLKEVEADLE